MGSTKKTISRDGRRSHSTHPLHVLLFTSLLCPISSYAESPSTNEPQANELLQLIRQQQQEIEALKQQMASQSLPPTPADMPHKDRELGIGGFFDLTAHTTDNSEHPFDLGSLELDMQYDQVRNFAVSTALVWDGDTSEVAVAVLDYHIASHDVPTRGPLFTQPGFHLQFGRFDIPFGIDYEFFAAPDRPNITAPLTTQRIQNDGLNGDGLRLYGAWSKLDYAIYWTNSLFEDNGSSVGARLGFFPGRDPYRVHNRDTQNDFTIGLSWLRDMDSEEKERNTLHALDVRWRYNIAEMIIEYVCLNNIDTVTLPGGGSAGPADESGYNARLLLDFDPMKLFIGYGEWSPDYSQMLDPEDPAISYPVQRLQRLTLGWAYVFDDYLQIKLEYLSHMDTATEEPDFEKRRLTFQMVASF